MITGIGRYFMPPFSKIKRQLFGFAIIAALSIILSLSLMGIINTLKKSWLETQFETIATSINIRIDDKGMDFQHFCRFIESVDTYYNVYAAVYSANLELLTKRHPDITPGRTVFFDPLIHDGLLSAAKTEQTGKINVHFEVIYDNGKKAVYFTPVFFRWFDDGITLMAIPQIPDTVDLPKFYAILIYTVFAGLFLTISFLVVSIIRKLGIQ